MSTSHSQESRPDQAGKRRKRKDRAKSGTVEPKNIVSGAGQPLDVSVRRELEEQLGHDFGRVRLHTDRDAGALTEMLGADAVAVGQDIFFREGAYRPGTVDGQRLLAHELLHTVQNPHGLGTLRAGRDLGAVSLPQQAMEREAESAAQSLVGEAAATSGEKAVRPEEADVRTGRATPGWLRYATVDADRRRMEELDPATLIDRVANGVLRSLRGDPEDRSGRVRLQLARLAPQLQELVLDRLAIRLSAPALDRVLDLVEETEAAGPLPLDAAVAPVALPGAGEEIAEERLRDRSADERPDARERRDGAGGGPEGQQDEPGAGDGGRPGTAGKEGAAGDGRCSTPPEEAASQDQEEAGARQQDRSRSQQVDKDASVREDNNASAQEQQQKAQEDGAQKDKARQDDRAAEEEREEAGGQEEAPQEPEQQAGEQPAGEDEAAVAGNLAAAPSPVDKSGAEPGERSRTGDARPVRNTGDPENEQDVDDEPLGLEAESEQDAAEEPDAGAAEGSGAADTGAGPTGPETADDPRLFQRRKRGAGRVPGISSTEGDSEPEPVEEAAEPDGSGSAPDRTDEADSESRTAQELSDVMSAEQDLGPEGTGGPGDTGPLPGLTSSEAVERDAEKQQAEQRSEDAEALRRDEEARNADGAKTAPPTAGGPVGPERLAKADEDARTQDAGSAQTSAKKADSGGQAEGTAKQGSQPAGAPAKSETEPSAGSDKGAGKPVAMGEDTTGAGDSDTGAGTPEVKPAPVPDHRGVTEGNGNATSPGPESGPDKVSTPGSGSGSGPAPQLASGNGPSPMSTTEAKTNSPKIQGASGSGTVNATRSKPSRGKRQAARQVARNARRTGARGGGGRPSAAPARGGGAGAGASAPAKAKKQAAAPDVSNATPEAGLATAAGLKPHQMLDTLRGVNSAVGRSVDKERTALRKAPPKEQRPSGSPRTVPGGPTASAPGTYTNAKVARTEAAPGSTPEISGEQKPEGDVPGANVPEPSWWDIAVTIGAQLFGKLLKEILPLDDLIDSILGLPTKDEGLQNAKVGDAPRLPLENDSDPQRTDEQAQKLDERKTELHRSGRADAARPMGEDQIYPDVPEETLTGKVPGGNGRNAKGAGRTMPGGGVPIESASAVAEHDRGPQIQAGFGEGRQKMSQERKNKDAKAREDRQKHDQDLKREVDASSEKQAEARHKGRSDISDSRDKWRKEQDDKTSEIDGKKGKKYDEVRKDIKGKEEETDKDVDKRTEDDNKKIADEQSNAEKEAEKKQKEGKDDADNWLEDAIEKLKQFFEDLKNAIKSVFEKARQIVTDLIDKFKQQVFKLIDDARNWVIDKINKFADVLIALGDELLADYPAMRDKWRNTIDGARDWAVEKVNQLADGLKEVAGKLLDGLCGALLAGLDVLETGMLAAVEVAETAAVGALEFGAAVVEGLGEWAAIFNDIVSDPGGWISKAGAAANSGARDHLFNEVTSAVKAWFNQKVQEIIGIPMDQFQELISGGVTVEQMAQMAWDEALPQLPVIIGVLVVEKVVAKLIPGAGWVMAIIDALKTAWGALSEILAAFGLFMDFLKSVKSGNGAQPFAKAVAAGVVALLELIYEFLIEGVGKFMGKVAEKLGDMLKNIRRKKDKPDGSDAPPPDAPSKPKDDESKGDDRTTPDKPGDKDTDTPTTRKPPPDKTSRPPARPRPGKRSSPEKKPSHTTRPKKRRDDDERREEGREVNAARKRIRDGERRSTRDDKDDSPSRRGPARDTLRPDRRKDDDRPRDPDKDRDRDRDGDRDKDRKRDKDRDRDRKRDKDRRRDRRARQTVKSARSRARRAADRLRGKARRKLGNRLNDRLRRLKDLWRRRRDRRRDDDRSRTPGRNRRDRRDDGTESVDLPDVPFADADDGERHVLRFHGRGTDAGLYVHSIPEEVTKFIAEWREDIAKQEPSTERDNQELYLKAAVSKYNRATRIQKGIPAKVKKADRDKYKSRRRALRKQMVKLANAARLREYNDIPDPKWPDFDVAKPGRGSAGHFSEYLGTSAKTVFGGPGQDASMAKKGQPPGWDYITKNGLSENSAWVRMHLLPERLGGKATGNNLVPARGPQTNIPFRQNIEDQAYGAIPQQQKIIWYKTEARFGYSRTKDFADFPSYIHAAYGGYEKIRGTGKKRSDWTRKGTEKQYARHVGPPDKDEGGTLFINMAGATTIAGMLECSERLAGHVIDAREDAGKFKTLLGIGPVLRAWKGRRGADFMPGLPDMLDKLDDLIAQDKVKLTV
ncbi:hypothetical protein GCM10010271_60190 [Streptomyces kurssanovii]|nr:hypothetical protein GCM10010271_60190 [Streptomyces kurssanovii]